MHFESAETNLENIFLTSLRSLFIWFLKASTASSADVKHDPVIYLLLPEVLSW